MFRFEYVTRYGDYKDFEMLRPALALDIAQDVAVRHSDSLGYGLETMRDMHMAWLLQGVRVRFEKPMNIRSPLQVFTAVRTMKGVTSERGCIIEQDGQVVAKTLSNWFLSDVLSLRPCRIPAEMAVAYPIYDFGDPFFRYVKPKTREAQPLYTFRVCPREIDTNCHLNNHKSAEILMDALPMDFAIREMNVLYKKSAYLGDELSLCAAETEGGRYVHLLDRDGDICVAGEFLG